MVEQLNCILLGMYDFQSRSRERSFATMTSFFRRSFKRPSAFDSGRTHRITSIQSLSVIVTGELSYFCSACLAFTNSLAHLSIFVFDCDSTFFASKASCSFWALNTTLALPILVPHTAHKPPAEKLPFVSTSCLTCASSSALRSKRLIELEFVVRDLRKY